MKLTQVLSLAFLPTLLAAPALATAPTAPSTQGSPASLGHPQEYDVKVSPFSGLRWAKGGSPEVEVGDAWYRPLKIDGLDVSKILAFCEMRWPGQQQKRFGEDLVEAMVLMGHRPADGAWRKTTLVVATLDSDGPGVEKTLEGVAMTRANRRAIRDASARPAPPPQPRVVAADVARADLEVFGEKLRERFAYLEARGVDLDAGLRAIASGLAEEVSVPQLAEDLNGLLMRFGDGHASVSAGRVRETEHLPCLLQEAGEGVVAFLPDRSGFVDPKRPFVQAIDGRSIEEWIEAARPLVSSGSEALVRHRTLRLMREIQRVRRAAGDEPAAGAEVVLSSRSKGGSKKTRTLKLSGRRPTYGPWPRGKTRLLEGRAASGLKGGVGVLRLAEMDDELVPELREAMTRFRNTAGLIVDVRGNGGGRRGLLEALAGYLANDGPVVGNCAAYRLAPGFDRDHLGGARLLYRADDERWSDEQSQAIARFAESFEPEWKLPDGFSEWHYLVLDRTGHRAEYAYTKPVVVLIDAGCFSATDIFAAAMGELPGVTLLGETTSGGSARVQSFELPSTGIRVRCASMASFQPNGRLYDGNGVSPDIEVSSDPADLLRGDSDAQLAAAVKLIAKRTR